MKAHFFLERILSHQTLDSAHSAAHLITTTFADMDAEAGGAEVEGTRISPGYKGHPTVWITRRYSRDERSFNPVPFPGRGSAVRLLLRRRVSPRTCLSSSRRGAPSPSRQSLLPSTR